MDLPGRSPHDEEQPLKADPFAQLRLLDVQELDSRLDLLRHQRATLSEHLELRTLSAARAEVAVAESVLRVEVDDLVREQRKADADVEQVKARRGRDRDRLDRGLVSNPKDLEHLQHEVLSLDRRIGALEDEELEVMERLDRTESELTGLQQQLASIDARGAELTDARTLRTGEIDAEVAAVTAERDRTASGVPADLQTLYERLREQKAGVGAAALRARRCGGCSLELNAGDLAAIKAKPSDEVVRCEECARILVRTAESGL